MKQVKYTWKLMHGDADHYDKMELILSNEAEIAFFDYVQKLNFEKRFCEGFSECDVEEKQEFIRLYIATLDDAEKERGVENYYIEGWISDTLWDWGWMKPDCTCDGMHYAEVQNFKREEIQVFKNGDELRTNTYYTKEEGWINTINLPCIYVSDLVDKIDEKVASLVMDYNGDYSISEKSSLSEKE